MFDLIPLIIILISLAVIIIIVARKFSVLANLDVDTIQVEREIKIKERIISSRLKRNYYNYQNKALNVLRPVGGKASELLKSSYDRLLELKENYNRDVKKVMNETENTPENNAQLMIEVKELKNREDYDEAEKKLIEIIGKDSGNFKAFRSLGELYYERKDFHEAKETLDHTLKLMEKKLTELLLLNETGSQGDEKKRERDALSLELAIVYYDKAMVNRAVDNFSGALLDIDNSLKIEPNNPRYLDTKFELSIISRDKIKAWEAFEKMKEVNPENQKLEEMKGRLGEL